MSDNAIVLIIIAYTRLFMKHPSALYNLTSTQEGPPARDHKIKDFLMAGSRKAKILFLARNGGEPKIPSRNLMKLIFHNNRVVAIYFLCFTRLKIKPLANSDWAEKTKGSWTHENT